MFRQYGPVFRENTFFQRSITVVSPQAVQMVFRDTEHIFSSKWGWHNMLGRFFHGGLMLRDFDEHKIHRRIIASAFATSALQGYLGLMNPIVRQHVAAWGDQPGFRFHPAAKRMTLDMAKVVFAGLSLGEQELTQYDRSFTAMMAASLALLRWNVPGTTYWRGLRGRQQLEQVFRDLIPLKRKSDDADLLAQLCHAVSQEGERLTDEEIVDHMIFMMVAAHDTTTSALTNMVWALAAHPEWQERLRATVLEVDRQEVSYDDLAAFEDVEHVLKETLRLEPPVIGIPRMTLRECEIDGHRIPAYCVVWLAPRVTQRLPEYWSNPDDFDPERFSEGRAEHKQHPGLWFPYGNGTHLCLGMHFSVIQVKAVVNQMLRRYRLTLPADYAPKRQVIPFPKPIDDLPVILEPR